VVRLTKASKESTVQTKVLFQVDHAFLGCKTKTGVLRILIVFQDRSLFSNMILKISARAFHSVWNTEHRSILNNKGVMRILDSFEGRPMSSHVIQIMVSMRAFYSCG